ncbi:hypothetical protein CZ771_01275 [Actinomycetales bacterium JB111]|nr:hypothetical protein CZ771_01275 [Actinomycetales bacterium JB111]
MGRFIYDSSAKVDIEDRALAHVQLVIGAKLRRMEAFHFTWHNDVSQGGGRTCVWLQPGIPIVYTYFGGRRPSINNAWLEALNTTANSSEGLHLVHEPPREPESEDSRFIL